MDCVPCTNKSPVIVISPFATTSSLLIVSAASIELVKLLKSVLILPDSVSMEDNLLSAEEV